VRRRRAIVYNDRVTRPAPTTSREQLHAAGLRATPARIAVLDVLHGAQAGATHGEVVDALEGRGWDRATIFRNLVTLVDAGLAVRNDLGDHVWRFSVATQSTGVHEHPHLLCTACGTVTCIPGMELRVAKGARVPRSVRAQSVEIALRGLCDACA
jgi:Fur family transcriptional regulator, ferric uptake regulator